MTYLEQIDAKIKDAMRAKESFRLGVLRLIKSDLKNKEIELKKPVSEADFNATLSRMIKQRKESAEQYRKGDRNDLAENEEAEIQVVQEFLPQPLSEEELTTLIASAIKDTGAEGPQGMGLVMKELKDKTSGRVDGKVLADKVKAALNN